MAITILNATISKGTALSNAIQISGSPVVRLIMPTPWDYAGGISFQCSPDGVTFRDLFDTAAGELVMKVEPGVEVWIGSPRFAITNTYLKIRSGTRANPVNQTADRVFQIIVDPNAIK
jgi:hypothetical protein